MPKVLTGFLAALAVIFLCGAVTEPWATFVTGSSAVSSVTGTDVIADIQSGATKQATAAQISTYIGSATQALTNKTSLNFSGNQVYSNGASGLTNYWLNNYQPTMSGGPTASNPAGPFNFYVLTDTVDTNNTGMTLANFEDRIAAGATGGRTVLGSTLLMSGTITPSTGFGYVSGQWNTNENAYFGGTTGAYANYAGGGFAGNCNIYTGTNATFLTLLTCEEFDIALVSGASAAEKHAITVVQTSTDATRGAWDDAAIDFNNQDGSSTTWLNGILFGAYAHKYPFGVDSTLIGAVGRTAPTPTTAVAEWGLDLLPVTFSTATVSGVATAGTAGQFSCTCTGLYVGMSLTITGALGGSGSITGYSSPTTYNVSATNGTSTFTLVTSANAAIVTTAGTLTGLTYKATGGFLRSLGFSVDPSGNVVGATITASTAFVPTGQVAPTLGIYSPFGNSVGISVGGALKLGVGTDIINYGPIVSAGTMFSPASGTGACASSGSAHGGSVAGDITCTGTTGASTITLTMGAGTTAAYTCWGRDITTPTIVTQTGAKSTTSVTFTLTLVTANDVIQFGCLGY